MADVGQTVWGLALVGLALVVWAVPSCTAQEEQQASKSKRVVIVAIDGLRPDALAKARTPNLDTLIKRGAFTDTTQILGTRYRENDTVSGPGWSSILTGVWADKHGVHDNRFGTMIIASPGSTCYNLRPNSVSRGQ